MPAKKKPVKKEEEESSSCSSSSDSDSSSSGEAPAPKKKVTSKAKAKDTKTEEVFGEKEDKAEGAAEKKDDAAADKPAEEEKKVFEPPPRAVFRPHTDAGQIKGPADPELEYCPTCGLPPDFCVFGPSWKQCQPWCLENYPQYYPNLLGKSIDDAKKTAAEVEAKGKVKELPGGKIKRSASPSIQIKKMSRGGRKCVTSVAGLELFSVKLDEAAKKFKNKFACGAAVVKGDNGLPDTVDIQGDFYEELSELITKDFKVPTAKISFEDGGTKKKGKPSGR